MSGNAWPMRAVDQVYHCFQRCHEHPLGRIVSNPLDPRTGPEAGDRIG
jgi:hypothetical protein